jgi:hypothetical protein
MGGEYMPDSSQLQTTNQDLDCSFSSFEFFIAPIKPTTFEEKGSLKISNSEVNYAGNKYKIQFDNISSLAILQVPGTGLKMISVEYKDKKNNEKKFMLGGTIETSKEWEEDIQKIYDALQTWRDSKTAPEATSAAAPTPVPTPAATPTTYTYTYTHTSSNTYTNNNTRACTNSSSDPDTCSGTYTGSHTGTCCCRRNHNCGDKDSGASS